MRPRIERRRAQAGRWLLYPLIALSAAALAKLATAAPPAAGTTVYRVVPLSTSVFSGVVDGRGQVAFSERIGGGGQRATFHDGGTLPWQPKPARAAPGRRSPMAR